MRRTAYSSNHRRAPGSSSRTSSALQRRLPAHARGAAEFAYLTGWRINSEVLNLEWRRVDFAGGSVRLDPGQATNREPRGFPMTQALRTLLEAQRKTTDAAQRRLGKVITILFHHEGAPVSRFDKLWKVAATRPGSRPLFPTTCAVAGCAISCARGFPSASRCR